jgi:quinolinate synthase
MADFIGSTQALLNYTIQSDKKKFLVATESGILHEMQKKNPDKEFIPVPPNDSTCACNDCNFMKLNTLEKLYLCLKNEYPEILVDEEIRVKAVKPIIKMLEMS